MKVAVLMDGFPGPTETFILHHIVGLLEAGHDVVIFARRPPGVVRAHPDVDRHHLMSMVRYLPNQEFGVRQWLEVPGTLARGRVHPGSARCLDPWRYGPGVARLRALHGLATVARESFDLIHCHYASIGWAFLPYRDIFGVPFVTSFHGDHYGSFGRDGRWLLRRLFEQGDAFVANSDFTRGELIRLGCPAPKIWKIPAIADERGVVFRTHGPRRGPAQVLTVARLHESKGVQVALRAVRVLRDRGAPVQYHVAGDGPYRGRLEALVDELGIREQVFFHGWMPQDLAYRLYAKADLFVLPSVGSSNGANEAQGLVIQEAQLHGVPVLASELGGTPESVEWGRSGRLFRRGDHDELAGAIQAALADPVQTGAIAARALAYVREKYVQAVVVKQVVELYEGLLAPVGARAAVG